jgi:hypothetical protein
VSSVGRWSLDRLGYGDLTFAPPAGQRSGVVETRFALPEGAGQGKDHWYTITVNFHIEFADDAGDGTAYLIADTNESIAVLIKFQTEKRADGLNIRWKTAGRLDGQRDYAATGPGVSGTFTNFLLRDGLRAGENTLRFIIEQWDGAKIKAVHISRDSGLEVGDNAPAALRISQTGPKGAVRRGDTFTVSYSIANIGDLPATGIRVRADHRKDQFEVIGDGVHTFDSLGRESRDGQFTLRALKPGRHVMGIMASSSANRPGEMLVIDVVERRGWLRLWMVPAALMLVLSTIGLGRAAVQRRHDR